MFHKEILHTKSLEISGGGVIFKEINHKEFIRRSLGTMESLRKSYIRISFETPYKKMFKEMCLKGILQKKSLFSGIL